MKKFKFYIYSVVALVAINHSALAKGYYYDLSISQNQVKHDIKINDVNGSNRTVNQLATPSGATPLFAFNLKNDDPGISLKFGKKFSKINGTNFFLSPAITYDYINNSVNDTNNFEYTIKDRIVADISLGYDVNKYFSSYISYGLGDVGYDVNGNTNVNYETSLDVNNPTPKDLGNYSNRNSSDIFGFGAKYKVNSNLFIVFDYSKQKIDLSSEHGRTSGGVTYMESNSSIESFKIGVSKNL